MEPEKRDEMPPSIRTAMEDAFREWYGLNDRAIYDGDTGDVFQLFCMLKTVLAKWPMVSSETPKEF
jgi:hypothetical protein